MTTVVMETPTTTNAELPPGLAGVHNVQLPKRMMPTVAVSADRFDVTIQELTVGDLRAMLNNEDVVAALDAFTSNILTVKDRQGYDYTPDELSVGELANIVQAYVGQSVGSVANPTSG